MYMDHVSFIQINDGKSYIWYFAHVLTFLEKT